MNIKRSTRIRVLIGGVVLAGSVALNAAPVAAAPLPSGVVKGDACAGKTTYSVWPGAKTCLQNGLSLSGVSFAFQAIAVDTKSDGHSARIEVAVEQHTPVAGGSHRTTTTNRYAVTDSSGFGTSAIGGLSTVKRLAGADSYTIWQKACTYESGSRTYVTCTGWFNVRSDKWVLPIVL